MTDDIMQILIVDDHAILRSGLRLLIDAQPTLNVVGEAGSGADAVTQARALQPDLILLDLSMPDGDGLSIIATLRSMEYFINSERAFVTMHHALRDAQERRRSDLVQRYTDTMATLVRNTSYSEVISRIREKMGQ